MLLRIHRLSIHSPPRGHPYPRRFHLPPESHPLMYRCHDAGSPSILATRIFGLKRFLLIYSVQTAEFESKKLIPLLTPRCQHNDRKPESSVGSSCMSPSRPIFRHHDIQNHETDILFLKEDINSLLAISLPPERGIL